jgi:endonuclease/exonuclease/phosphatase family metal-dependent hydrolase
VPIPTLPNTSVTGQLTECTVKPLPNRQVSVTLVPKPGVTTISRIDQIGAVRVSSPSYGEVEITELRLLSSMDAYGRTYTAVDVGTVCLRPTGPTQPATPTAPISGKTDSEGKFSVPLPWPGATVSGRLTECTVKPLPNQEFTLTLVPKGETLASPEDIAAFAFKVPGYQETTVTQFSKLSLFGLTWYETGPVCLFTITCPEIPLRVLTQNTKRITHGDNTLPAREQEIFKLLRGPIEYNFDIVCLQEWFQDAGPAGAIGLEAWSTQKGPLLRHWLGLSAQPDLTERDVENIDVGGIRIVDARPNSRACEIIVGPNYVAGPDAAWFLESRIDGGLVILTRPGLTIVRASAFVFSESAGWDWYASKGALYARVQLDPENPSCYLHVFNTHLQAGEGTEPQRIRQTQLEELRRFIENCTSDDRLQGRVQHPVILCGDFNIIGGSQEWQNHLQNLAIAGQNFKDAWLASGKKDQPAKDAATWVGNDQNTSGTPWGPRNVLAAEPGDFQRLDYIFFSPGDSPLGLVLLSVDREPANPPGPDQKPYAWDGYTVSDHLGVTTLFVVKPK